MCRMRWICCPLSSPLLGCLGLTHGGRRKERTPPAGVGVGLLVHDAAEQARRALSSADLSMLGVLRIVTRVKDE